MFKIHLVRRRVLGLHHRAVDEVSQRTGHQHHDAHHEDPHQQLDLNRRLLYGQQNKGNQSHAGHAVGFKSVRARPNRIARVVTGAVGDHARVARVVFLNLEDDFHQIRPDVSNLRKNSACNSQRRRSQRFANRKSDKARSSVIRRNEEKNKQHDQQLHADQHHANAHARLKRNLMQRVGLSAQPGKRSPRIRKRIHANAKPRHAVTTSNPHQAEAQNNRQRHRHRLARHRR